MKNGIMGVVIQFSNQRFIQFEFIFKCFKQVRVKIPVGIIVRGMFGDAPYTYFFPGEGLLCGELMHHFIYAVHPVRVGFAKNYMNDFHSLNCFLARTHCQ